MVEQSKVNAESGRRFLRWLVARFDPGWLVVLLLPSFVAITLLQPGLPRTADGYLHLLRVVEIDQSWRDGVFYPRWAPDMAFGYGYPIFNYFAPMLYLLTEAVHVLGLGFESAFKLVVIACLVLGGWGAYSLAKDILGPRAGILAAAALVYAPFMLREIFVRGGYAQLLAICIMPAALWSFRRLLTRDHPLYLLTTSVLCGAVVFGHNVSGMLFFPFLALFGVWIIVSLRRWDKAKWMIVALIASLTMVSFFLVPVVLEQPLAQLDRLRQDYFDFSHHFLTLEEVLSPSAAPDSSSLNPVWRLNLGTAQVILGALGLVGIVICPLTREQKKQAAFFPVMLLVSVFMTLPASTPLWEHVPFLSFTQFPWRFLGIAILGAAVLAAASATLWSGLRWPHLRIALLGLVLTATVTAAFVHLYSQWPPGPREQLSAKDVVAHELRTGIIGSTSDGECLPVWVVDDPTGSPLVPQYLSSLPISKLDVDALPDSAQAELLEHTVVSDEYRLSTSEPLTVRFNTFYFPGWQALVDGEPVVIRPSYPEGLITFEVPPGEHHVSVRFGDTPVRKAANIVSVGSVLLVVGGTALLGVRRRREDIRSADLVPGGRLSLAEAGVLCLVLLALLLVKEGFVDTHTTWFRKTSPPGQVLGVEYPARVNLGNQVLFLGHDLSSERIVAGGRLDVRLYWEAQERLEEDYSSFLHLDDLRTNYISWSLSETQSPSNIPTSSWSPGFYVSDRHILSVSRETPPGVYVLRAGLYLPDTGERLGILDERGSAISHSIDLGRVQVLRPEPVDLSDAVRLGPVIFDDRIELVAYKLANSRAKPGNYFRLILYWRARTEVSSDYNIFVHLVDEEGQVYAQGDSAPANGIYPTWSWIPGEVVEDEHLVPMELKVPPGSYRLAVGLYELDNLSRLKVTDSGGAAPADQLLLPITLEVLAP